MPEASPPVARPRRRTAAALVVVALALVVGFPALPARAAKAPTPRVQLTVGDLAVERTGSEPSAFPADVRNKVMAALRTYVTVATVKALRKGRVDDAALGALVGPAVTTRVHGPDRDVLVDEGLGRATRRVVVKSAPVRLTGLADAQGRVVVVAAALDTVATTRTARGKVAIRRTGEIVLSPDANAWKITGYSLSVDRVGKGAAPAGREAPSAVEPSGAAPR